jgi:hypothetical protein
VFTDDDGNYTIEDVVTGDRGVNISAFGYFGSFNVVEVLDGETTTLDVELVEW